MENSDKAGSGTSSECGPNEVPEDMPKLIIIDEVRHLEAVKGSLPLEVLANRPRYAPYLGVALERLFAAALSNQTAATRTEEGDDTNSGDEPGSFVD
jgi:hypothetical protein